MGKLQRWSQAAKGLLKDWEEEAAQTGKVALTAPPFDMADVKWSPQDCGGGASQFASTLAGA